MKLFYNFRTDLRTLLALAPDIIALALERGLLTRELIVGTDGSADSGELLARLLSALPEGCAARSLGVCAAPALAFCCRLYGRGGIMVTASHCAGEMSGLKLFDRSGSILSDAEERGIAAALPLHARENRASGGVQARRMSADAYIDEFRRLRRGVKHRISWIVAGGLRPFVESCLAGFDDEIITSGEADPERRPAPEGLAVSLDADGDKFILYDGGRVNENRVILGLARGLGAKLLVTNREAHPELERLLAASGTACRYAAVGDQFLLDVLRGTDPRLRPLGAEPNGHIILPGGGCPDGLLSPLRYLAGAEPEAARFPFSKAVFAFDGEDERAAALRRILGAGLAEETASGEYTLKSDGVRCFVRTSLWERSVVALTFGPESGRALDRIAALGGGHIGRRIDYVEH